MLIGGIYRVTAQNKKITVLLAHFVVFVCLRFLIYMAGNRVKYLTGFTLQVLEGVIKYRWNALPVEQRDGMKNYISEVIVKV